MFLICVHGCACMCVHMCLRATATLENNECVLLIWALGDCLSLLLEDCLKSVASLSLHLFSPPLTLCMQANLALALMRFPAGLLFSYPNAGISRLLFSKAHLILFSLFLSACSLPDPRKQRRGLNNLTTTALLLCFCVSVVSLGT